MIKTTLITQPLSLNQRYSRKYGWIGQRHGRTYVSDDAMYSWDAWLARAEEQYASEANNERGA